MKSFSYLIHRSKLKVKWLLRHKQPFLCVITPIFNDALEPLKELIDDLKRQTYKSFIHVLISNGESPKIKSYIEEINREDKRFRYDEISYDNTYEKTKKFRDLLSNIGKRRDYVMKKYDADRYVNLGADFQITSDTFIEGLEYFHKKLKKDIIFLQVELGGQTFPTDPFKLGGIDLSNITYSKKIAKEYNYPNDYDPEYGAANDYRFLRRILNNTIVGFQYGIKDGRSSYKSLGELYEEENPQKVRTTNTWTLLGAGNFTNEVIEAIELNGGSVKTIVLNMDVSKEILERLPKEIEIIWLKDFKPSTEKYFLGFMNPEKDELLKDLSKYNLEYQNIIHPSAIISKSAQLGKGNFVNAGCVIGSKVKIGDFNFLNRLSSIGHDTQVGNFNRIGPGVTICSLCLIEDKNFFGANSTIIEKIHIGNEVIVGAGSVVVKNLLEAGIYIGIPVKKIMKTEFISSITK